MRASAREAPRILAVSSAQEAISFIYDYRDKDDIVFAIRSAKLHEEGVGTANLF
jgi:hypothetical protein